MRFLWACLATQILLPGAARAFEFPAQHGAGFSFRGGSFDDTSFEDISYVRSDLVDSLFGGVSHWNPAAQQLHMRDRKGREWIFTLDDPFMAVDGQVFNLTYPARRDAEGF